MAVSAKEVEDAVNEFYKNPTGKNDVHNWLTQAQHSTYAWTFAFQLLDPTKSGEVQFYGGNTIYIKVSRHWHEVPEEEYESLKRKLLELIVQFADSKAIAIRLFKAMAAFVLNTIASTWPHALEDLVATFNPDTITGVSPGTALDILFTILMIIPDELEDCHETMGISRPGKNVLRSLLRENSKGILTLMQKVMQANQVSNITKEIVIKALDSWMKLPLPLTQTKDLLLALIPYSKYGILCETVIECLKTAISDNDCSRSPETLMHFIMELMQLTAVLEEALHVEDENTASLIYGLFTTIVENHSRLLLKFALEDQDEKRAAVLQLITLLVQCSGTPGQYPTHETLSNIPFSVWYSLQDDLTMVFEGEEREQLMLLLRPIYLQLVDTFLHKSLLPPDEALSSEERELFRCYRQDICDSYMYTYIILKCSMLEQMERHLHNNVARLQRDPQDWRPLESLLHAYASIAETVVDSDITYIPRFIQFIPQIPFRENVHLITVALSTLGAYADWLNYHQDYLEYVIPLMVAGVVNERLVGAASQALRDLTLECPGTIAPFAIPILDSCQKALVQFPRVESAVKERIITIIARVLSVGAPHETVITHLSQTLTPIIANINTIKENVTSRGSFTKEERMELVCHIKLLACLARHLNANCSQQETGLPTMHQQAIQLQLSVEDQQPLLLVLKPLLPILDSLIEKTATMPDVVEVMCKLMKNSISTLIIHTEPILPELMSIIPRLYYSSLHPAVLDVTKAILLLFGGASSDHVQSMQALVEGILTYTLQRVNSDLWNNTHVVHAVLALSTNICKKLPHLLHPQQVHALFMLGIEALKLPEEGTMKAATHFLSHFITLSRDQKGAIYEPVVHQNTEHFIRTLMACICNSPRHSLAHISELLFLICKYYGGVDLMTTFRSLEQDASFLSPKISQQEKQKFSKAILRASTLKDSINAVTDLALTSRGVAGTEYGAATSLLPRYI